MTVVCGIDPGMGGGHATVTADLGEHLTILDAVVEYDFSQTEQQLASVEHHASVYRPQTIIIEYDAQQKALGNDDRLAELARRYGFTVIPHLTRMVKLDQAFGVAAMDQSFRDGLIRIPYGDAYTRQRMEPLIHQLRAWRPDVPTKRLTQDLVMALWFTHLYWMRIRKAQANQHVPAQRRPSWVMQDIRYAR